MAAPVADVKILSLGKNSTISSQKIASVTMLGGTEKLKWKQESDALAIAKPSALPAGQVVTFKIVFK